MNDQDDDLSQPSRELAPGESHTPVKQFEKTNSASPVKESSMHASMTKSENVRQFVQPNQDENLNSKRYTSTLFGSNSLLKPDQDHNSGSQPSLFPPINARHSTVPLRGSVESSPSKKKKKKAKENDDQTLSKLSIGSLEDPSTRIVEGLNQISRHNNPEIQKPISVSLIPGKTSKKNKVENFNPKPDPLAVTGNNFAVVKGEASFLEEDEYQTNQVSNSPDKRASQSSIGNLLKDRLKDGIRKKWIDPLSDKLTRAKYRGISERQQARLVTGFGQEFPEIVTLIKLDENSDGFAQVWSKIMLLTFVYNYFTFFWMFGFIAFPKRLWFGLEVITEILTLADFLISLVFSRWFSERWAAMHLLHRDGDKKLVKKIMRGVASLPFSFMLAHALKFDQQRLSSFWIASVRLLKLYHFRGFKNYFDANQINKSERSAGLFNLMATLFNFILLVHFMTMLFIVPERSHSKDHADHNSWWKVAGYFEYPVPNWQKYLDSMTYCVSNMSGMGWGNIVPQVNFEFFMGCVVFTTGCTAYLKFYSDILYLIEMSNRQFMENSIKLDEFNYLANVRHIHPELRRKAKYYYQHLRIPFEEVKARKNILKGLPASLQSDLAQVINGDLIEAVEFFQEAGPDFIKKISRYLTPQIMMANQHVIYRHALAERMYFINEGVVEVLAADEKTLIRFLSRGEFFGEIGILIEPHKCTLSVVARTTTLLYYVKEEDMQEILGEFPEQKRELYQLATERLKIIDAVSIDKENEKEQIESQIKQLESSNTVFGKSSPDSESKLPMLMKEFTTNMIEQNRYEENKPIMVGYQWFKPSTELMPEDNNNVDVSVDEFSFFEAKTSNQKRQKLWQASNKSPDLPYFLIEIFSPLYLVWNLIMLVVILYDQIVLTFSIAFEYELEGKFIAIDVVCMCLLAVDIFMRAKTAITGPNRICFEKDKVLEYYINTWLILDVFACFPFCYCLIGSKGISSTMIALARLPRLLKILRLVETIEIFEYNTDLSIQIYRIGELCLLFFLSGNLLACVFGALGRYEDQASRRFNGISLFKHIESQVYMSGMIDKITSLTKWQQYTQMLYLGIGITGSCPYGDSVPYSWPEQVLGVVAQIWARVFLAYFNSQFASLLGSMYSAKANQVTRLERTLRWMKHNSVSDEVIQSYKEYEDNLWDDFEGNDEETILKGLPRMLRYEVRFNVFRHFICHWEPLKSECQGVIFSIVNYLRIFIYPAQEFVFQVGEVKRQMYFVLNGTVEVRSSTNELLAVLGPGKSFGETALLEESAGQWRKNVYCPTMVCLAILRIPKFQKVAKMYPQLREKVQMLVQTQKKKQKAKATRNSKQDETTSILLQANENQPEEIRPNPEVQSQLKQSNKSMSIEGAQTAEQEESSKPTTKVTRQLTRSKLRKAKSIDGFFEEEEAFDDKQADQQQDCFSKYKQVHKRIVQFFVFYNLVFIPLQFAFRLSFKKKFFLIMEILTIVTYLVEFGLRVYKIRRLVKIKNMPIDENTCKTAIDLASDIYKLRQEIQQQRKKIIVTFIAALPFSLIFALNEVHEPFGFLVLLRSLRLLKIRPFRRFWVWLQSYQFNILTLVESVCLYYVAAHWLACYSIGMAIFEPDHRLNWLRRLPAPMTTVRETPSVFDDLSHVQIYSNALYFQVNTFSTLTLGDVAPVTFKEKLLVCFNIFIGCVMYNILFANITTVVAYMSQGSHIEFFKNYSNIIAKIDNGKVDKETVDSASNFFYFVWNRHQGVSYEEVINFLPPSMSSKLCISVYKQAIERSIVFRDDEGNINIPLIISVFKAIKFKTFRASDLIIKIGQPTEHTYMLIEGELRVYGICGNELLGILTQGTHFGLDLSDDAEEVKQISKYDRRLKGNFQMDPTDNLNNRSLVNIFTNQFATVAIIKKAHRDELYKTFPEFKRKMQFMNRVIFQLGIVSLEKDYDDHLQVSKELFQQTLIENIANSTKESYQEIIDQSVLMPENKQDLSFFIKSCSAQTLFPQEVLEEENFRQKILVSHLLQTSYNSLGQSVMKQKTRHCPAFCRVKRDSKSVQVIRVLHFLNILYMAFAIPFQIAFKKGTYSSANIVGEIVSLTISALYVVMRFRIPVIEHGSETRKCKAVTKRYFNEGLIIDLFGLLPLNLVLHIMYAANSEWDDDFTNAQKIIVAIFMLLRVVSTLRGLSLIEEFTVNLTSASYFIILIKAFAIWFNIGHLMSCAWFYLNTVIEQDKTNTWFNQQSLSDKTTAEQYLRVYYLTLNIGTGIGSGDMLPQNELERVGIMLFMTTGDVFFVFGFGLIIYFFSLQREGSAKEEIAQRIRQINQLGEDKTLVEQKHRIHKYFAFLYYQKQNAFIIDKKELKQNLPTTIVQEIVIQANKELFDVIFRDIKCENLIRELCLNLKYEIHLPEDFVYSKGDKASHVFFIADGSLFMLCASKKNIVKTMSQGEYFGEVEIVYKSKQREHYVQAATFCTLSRIRKKKIKSIAAAYPQLLNQFESTASETSKQLNKYNLTKVSINSSISVLGSLSISQGVMKNRITNRQANETEREVLINKDK